MKEKAIDPSGIPGWGVDVDPKNDPTYPIKKRNNGEHAGYSWERPAQQPVTVEVLHSNERPNVAPSSGVDAPQGQRCDRVRFQYSESRYGTGCDDGGRCVGVVEVSWRMCTGSP